MSVWSNKPQTTNHKPSTHFTYPLAIQLFRLYHRLKGSEIPRSSSVSNPIISITSRSSLSIPSAILPITSRHWLRLCLQIFSARAISDRRFASSAGSITSALPFTPPFLNYVCRLSTRSSIRLILAAISAMPFSSSASLRAKSNSFSSTLQTLCATNHSLACSLRFGETFLPLPMLRSLGPSSEFRLHRFQEIGFGQQNTLCSFQIPFRWFSH